MNEEVALIGSIALIIIGLGLLKWTLTFIEAMTQNAKTWVRWLLLLPLIFLGLLYVYWVTSTGDTFFGLYIRPFAFAIVVMFFLEKMTYNKFVVTAGGVLYIAVRIGALIVDINESMSVHIWNLVQVIIIVLIIIIKIVRFYILVNALKEMDE